MQENRRSADKWGCAGSLPWRPDQSPQHFIFLNDGGSIACPLFGLSGGPGYRSWCANVAGGGPKSVTRLWSQIFVSATAFKQFHFFLDYNLCTGHEVFIS